MKLPKFPLLLLAMLFILLVGIEYMKPKPLNWEVSFSSSRKIPYGAFVFHDYLKNFLYADIETSHVPFSGIYSNDFPTGSIFIVYTDNFDPDSYEWERMQEILNDGNHILIISTEFGRLLLDTLDISLRFNFEDVALKTTKVQFFADTLQGNSFVVNKMAGYYFFLDSCRSVELIGGISLAQPDFIKIPSLEQDGGAMYLNMNPLAFTNFHMLDSANYVVRAMNYLPNGHLVWDEYYKPKSEASQNPLRVIMQLQHLRVAFFILVLSLAVFFIFGSKRKYSYIPLYSPFINTSREYVVTLSRLYLSGKNHTDMANKKLLYFREYLRQLYQITPDLLKRENIQLLSQRTGVSKEIILNFLDISDYIRSQNNIGENSLKRLSEAIKDFKNFKK